MQYTEPKLLSALQEGTLSFAYGISLWLFALLVVLIIFCVWLTYLKTTRPLTRGWKTCLIAVRSSVLLLLLFCLLRPVITILQVSPQETYLGVLIDDSQSMSIEDMEGGLSRHAAVEGQILNDSLLEELSDSFQIRSFRFDKQTQRIAGTDDLSEAGTASSIAQALRYVSDQLNGLPLGGILLISDGADNSDSDPVIVAQDFGARQIPIFAIGVGQEEIPQDIGIVDVSAAKTVLEGSLFNVQVAILHHGYEGQEVELSIMDGDTRIASKTVIMGGEGITRRFDLELTPERQELIVYDLNVELQFDEIINENNSYSFLVDNTEKPPLDILYIEGHPRNEYKFIRRALEGDNSLRLATYLQTGPEKYYRQGIESPTDLSEIGRASRRERV